MKDEKIFNKPIRQEINGWLAIDKPYGMSSAQVVAKVKHLLHPMKIGHAGTLDPLATGVLPLALGKATKTIPYVMDGSKIYRFEVTFGKKTATDDAEGEVTDECSFIPSKEEIEMVLPSLTGKILQTPPVYSALKINGRRAYELAREGKEVSLKNREIEIFSLNLVSQTDEKRFVFETECSKGTYIRSLACQIADLAGSLGFVSVLRRTKCHSFFEKDAILLEKLEEMVHNDTALDLISPVETALTDILELALTRELSEKLSFGQSLKAPGALAEGTILKAVFEGKAIALVAVKDGRLVPFRVFGLTS